MKRFAFASAAILASTAVLSAQTSASPPPPAPPPPAVSSSGTPSGSPSDMPPTLSGAAASTYDRRDSFPTVNVYLPEGQASIRLRKLIKNVLFESQIDYRFVNGDISTFLRYKYYAKNFTYRIGVFDTIEFPDVGSTSKQEFQRVRGGLFLLEVPKDYNNRYFWLLQNDRLTFGDLTSVDNRKNNIYTKVGYQYGTQFDERMNAIVGEYRGRIIPVLTAFRDIGPQKFGLAAAVTESGKIATGDYRYTKLEAEALRRWDITNTSFVVTRAHLGSFVTKDTIRGSDFPSLERYSIPQYEMFKLGGREALKAIKDKDVSEGTQELHVTNEYFVPVFRNRDYRTGLLHWNTLYGIGYLGGGTVGYEFSTFGKTKNYVVDAGLGTESSIFVRDYEILLSVVYAHTLHAPDGLKGNTVRFSLRTIR
jgi:hypothetical protein